MLFFKKKKPTIESFRWDTAGWTAKNIGDLDRTWTNDSGDMAIQKFRWEVPAGIPRDWRDVESLRRAMEAQRPPILASISVDVLRLPAGIMCGQYVNKEHMAKQTTGFLYHGMITIPFREFFCNFFFIAPEHGNTGFRESMLMATGKVKMPEQKEIPVINNQEELMEMYRQAKKEAPKVTDCDKEEFDAMFPKHPLSRLRHYLGHFRESLQVDEVVRDYFPFGS